MMRDQEEVVKKHRHLTPEEKYQIFLEATIAKAKENGSITLEVMARGFGQRPVNCWQRGLD